MEHNNEVLNEYEVQNVLYLHKTQKDSFEKIDKTFVLFENRIQSFEVKVDKLSQNFSAEFQSVGGGKLMNRKLKLRKN